MDLAAFRGIFGLKKAGPRIQALGRESQSQPPALHDFTSRTTPAEPEIERCHEIGIRYVEGLALIRNLPGNSRERTWGTCPE